MPLPAGQHEGGELADERAPNLARRVGGLRPRHHSCCRNPRCRSCRRSSILAANRPACSTSDWPHPALELLALPLRQGRRRRASCDIRCPGLRACWCRGGRPEPPRSTRTTDQSHRRDSPVDPRVGDQPAIARSGCGNDVFDRYGPRMAAPNGRFSNLCATALTSSRVTSSILARVSAMLRCSP